MKSGPVTPRIISPYGTTAPFWAHCAGEHGTVFSALMVAETIRAVQFIPFPCKAEMAVITTFLCASVREETLINLNDILDTALPIV
jgi:hypothetical protein